MSGTGRKAGDVPQHGRAPGSCVSGPFSARWSRTKRRPRRHRDGEVFAMGEAQTDAHRQPGPPSDAPATGEVTLLVPEAGVGGPGSTAGFRYAAARCIIYKYSPATSIKKASGAKCSVKALVSGAIKKHYFFFCAHELNAGRTPPHTWPCASHTGIGDVSSAGQKWWR